MNLYRKLNEEQIKLLKETDIIIRNEEYTQEQCKVIFHRVMDYIMSASKKKIPEEYEKYESILKILD